MDSVAEGVATRLLTGNTEASEALAGTPDSASLVGVEQRAVTPATASVEWDDLLYGAQPAPGASFAYTCLWDTRPLAVMCRLTTSPALGERTLILEYTDGSGVAYCLAGANVQIDPGSVNRFCWQPTVGVGSWPVANAVVAPLPPDTLKRGWRIALTLAGADTADQLDMIRLRLAFKASTSQDAL